MRGGQARVSGGGRETERDKRGRNRDCEFNKNAERETKAIQSERGTERERERGGGGGGGGVIDCELPEDGGPANQIMGGGMWVCLVKVNQARLSLESEVFHFSLPPPPHVSPMSPPSPPPSLITSLFSSRCYPKLIQIKVIKGPMLPKAC